MAVGHDDVLADVVEEFGKFLGRTHDAGLSVEHEVGAVVVPDDAGLDVAAGAVGAGVHVGNEADGGHGAVGIGRKGGVNIAVGIHLHLGQPQALQLLRQVLGQPKLLVGAGRFAGILGRLRVETHILEKSFYYIHNALFFCFSIHKSSAKLTAHKTKGKSFSIFPILPTRFAP